jgi:uncharacterized protein YndB with AHSA1/START domain
MFPWYVWLLIVLGILIGLVVLAALIGSLVPRDHVASRRATFPLSPQEVWDVVADLERRPEWFTFLKSATPLPDQDGKPMWKEDLGHGSAMTSRVDVCDPPRRLVTTIADGSLPFGGSWTFELLPAGEGTTVVVTESGFIKNPIFRFMARFLFGYTRTLEQYLRALGNRLGHEARIEG